MGAISNDKEELSNEKLFRYILGSLEMIQNQINNFQTIAELKQDIIIHDHICYRFQCLIAASKQIKTLKSSRTELFGFLYALELDLNIELIWHLGKDNSNDPYDSLEYFFKKIEELYFKECPPKIKKQSA